jgi:hypothetical protein
VPYQGNGYGRTLFEKSVTSFPVPEFPNLLWGTATFEQLNGMFERQSDKREAVQAAMLSSRGHNGHKSKNAITPHHAVLTESETLG